MGPHSEPMLATADVGKNIMELNSYSGLTSDSREVKPGYLFAALPGSQSNGADFIADAIKRGASAILAHPEAAALAQTVRFIPSENPRLSLAQAAAQFYGAQPAHIAAITGTNGKTSIAVFLRQIWNSLGQQAASLGTIGVVTPQGETPLKHTTPDPVEIHQLLAQLKGQGIDHLALEASSHGLDQYRLDGVNISAAAFANLTRDHLDYHQTLEAYLAAKLRLFTDLLRPDGVAVINAESDYAAHFIAAAEQRGIRLITIGETGSLKLLARQPHDHGQHLRVQFDGHTYEINLPLAGEFQASNALIAAGLAIGLGASAEAVFTQSLPGLKGAPGRLEKVAYAKHGAAIYVDYAHTPDALENVLTSLRPHLRGALHVVFGCGGNRDKGKRPLMGQIACIQADHVIITDDNPRLEDPATIRHEILAGCSKASEIADRAAAITTAVQALQSGDILVIAGKGHESGQIIGTTILPFSDRDEAIRAAALSGGHMAESATTALWSSDELSKATLGDASQNFGISSLSIDTRTLQPGALFIALQGNRDGHDFVAEAMARGASAALVSKELATDKPLMHVAHTQRGLEDMARAARARSHAKIIAVTGSAGKTTTKELLRTAFGALGPTHASAASYNNHWGVPLSLAGLPRDARYGIFEIGMNHFGEIRALSHFVRPHIALITTIAPAHLEFFGNCDAIADAKSEIFENLATGGAALIPADSPYAARLLARAAQAGVQSIATFGKTGFDAQLLGLEGQIATMRIQGDIVSITLGAPGEHMAINALGALLAVSLAGGDVKTAAYALRDFVPLKGRGERFIGHKGVEVIDESYNANPASMSAALALLAQTKTKGRHIAVLGDMLEMGADADLHHAALAAPLAAAHTDLVFLNGKHMRALWDVLPPALRGAYAATSGELSTQLLATLQQGDVVLVKGSFGSRMSVIIDALKSDQPPQGDH